MGWRFSKGRLYSSNGRSWSARSGPLGKGHLPDGLYVIGKATKIKHDKTNNAYRDLNNNFWWCPITPNFQTSRTGFGIHPDGGKKPGTKGCIGIQCADTTSLYNALKSAEGRALYVGDL